MRGLMEDDPVAACELLGVEVAGRPEVLPSVFSPGILTADLLLRVGPGRLAHVEYVRRASSDLAVRMLGYRWAVMREREGELLSQHVIVLGEGWVRGHDDLEQNGFRLDLNVIYLREVDPAGWLQNPSLAPLAALGRGSAARGVCAVVAGDPQAWGPAGGSVGSVRDVAGGGHLGCAYYLEDSRGGRYERG
jgi:hypothetical protein